MERFRRRHTQSLMLHESEVPEFVHPRSRCCLQGTCSSVRNNAGGTYAKLATLGSSTRSQAWSLFIVVEGWAEKVGGCGSAESDRAVVSYLQVRIEIRT
jgi:hypothetical protein